MKLYLGCNVIKISYSEGGEFSTLDLKVTIFPDKTSQVWKLPENVFKSLNVKIIWDFESEEELIHICQLCDLLNQTEVKYELHIPYLPYARQDKRIENNATFALHTFTRILGVFVNQIFSYDVHNPDAINAINLINIMPSTRISSIIEELNPTYILFPDEGAKKRYEKYVSGNIIYAEKVRDQSTGRIVEIKIPNIEDKSTILIIDDICDGGATFISLAEKIKEKSPNVSLALYVTHGIFSRGLNPLFSAGFSNIYTLEEDLI